MIQFSVKVEIVLLSFNRFAIFCKEARNVRSSVKVDVDLGALLFFSIKDMTDVRFTVAVQVNNTLIAPVTPLPPSVRRAVEAMCLVAS